MTDDARRWIGGKLPTAQYWAKVYAEERALAQQQVERELSQRRTHRLGRPAAQSGD